MSRLWEFQFKSMHVSTMIRSSLQVNDKDSNHIIKTRVSGVHNVKKLETPALRESDAVLLDF